MPATLTNARNAKWSQAVQLCLHLVLVLCRHNAHIFGILFDTTSAHDHCYSRSASGLCRTTFALGQAVQHCLCIGTDCSAGCCTGTGCSGTDPTPYTLDPPLNFLPHPQHSSIPIRACCYTLCSLSLLWEHGSGLCVVAMSVASVSWQCHKLSHFKPDPPPQRGQGANKPQEIFAARKL